MKSDKAPLIIDVQVNMFDEAMPVYNGDHLLQTVTGLIRQARSASMPVLFVRNNGSDHDPGGIYDQPFANDHHFRQ